MTKIGVLGAGAWGSALAQVCAAANDVVLWAFEKEVVDEINQNHTNENFLPNTKLDAKIHATSDLAQMGDCDMLLAVIPAQFMRRSFANLAPHIKAGTPIILCSKGIERGTHSLMTDVLKETIPQAVPCVLSGPSFAKDVAVGKPTAVTLACENRELGEKIQAAISIPTFRPYLADDLIGAEIGGAVKNVLAIACGVAEGRKLGESARSALITRGFAELARLGVIMGAKTETLMGLCGLGDLVLTCSSTTSRNFSLGKALGEGQSLEDALKGKLSVAEGAATAPALLELSLKHGVEMPISTAVAQILSGEKSVETAIIELLNRPLKQEKN
ncbi:NAD(P)H-dependent glycerol-3-phosphate dehydrogenase [Pseudaquidulcibacter saccharophilus]|uniref:NAD(P)H-dependent glycerol-3-phosphate dehydrogenase n=1 Tax=Pseudaquidulcibacter saccharophilus TaxID=2831900 RepID=UPI001EFF0921|nr:NAD(P)H-dependent glycerol-3-phosphate dehydrogenase [Pseudaquidulcibacter saccharophilus]